MKIDLNNTDTRNLLLQNYKNYVNSGGFQSSEMIIVHALFKNKKFDKFKKSFLSEGSTIALSLFNFKNELDAIRMKDILTSKVAGFSVKNSPSETAIEAFIPEFKSLTISERTYVSEYLLYKLDRYFDNFVF